MIPLLAYNPFTSTKYDTLLEFSQNAATKKMNYAIILDPGPNCRSSAITIRFKCPSQTAHCGIRKFETNECGAGIEISGNSPRSRPVSQI